MVTDETIKLAKGRYRYSVPRFTHIRNWQEIKSIERANIYGVKNPPVGFIEWAKEHGAVSIESHEKWLDFLDEKRQEITKEKL